MYCWGTVHQMLKGAYSWSEYHGMVAPQHDLERKADVSAGHVGQRTRAAILAKLGEIDAADGAERREAVRSIISAEMGWDAAPPGWDRQRCVLKFLRERDDFAAYADALALDATDEQQGSQHYTT